MTVYTDNEHNHAMMYPYVKPAGPPLRYMSVALFVRESVMLAGIHTSGTLAETVWRSYTSKFPLILHQGIRFMLTPGLFPMLREACS